MKTAKEIVESRSPLSLMATVEANITTGMFIWAGYIEALAAAQKEGFDDQNMPDGQIDLARQMTVSIPLIENVVTDELRANPGPGIWEYDVAEPLGAWLFSQIREYGQLPDTNVVVEKALELTTHFIKDWRGHEKQPD